MPIPCQSCPWRVSTRTEDIPGQGMDHARASEAIDGLTVMACHLSTDAHPVACAGYVVQHGLDRSIGLRLAVRRGALDVADFSDGGAELHPSMEAMLAAHPDRPSLISRSRRSS